MKKKSISILSTAILAVMFSNSINAQVGVNTITPKATLDVVGKPTDSNSLDGLIPPRITAEQLNPKTYTAEQTGALIYVTEPLNTLAPTAQTALVIEKGYYLFDGTKWIPFANRDTLYDVVERGNYAGRYMSFTGDAITKQGTREAGIGYNQTTRSYYFGGMNPLQTGVDNLGWGFNSLGSLTNGRGTIGIGNNAFSTSTGGTGNEYNSGVGLNVGRLFKGDHSVGFGVNALNSNWEGEQNTVIGQASMSDGVGAGKVSYNTTLGSNSLRLANQPFGMIAIGRDTGVRSASRNSVLIGNGLANSILYSGGFKQINKLLIHSFPLNDDGSYEEQNFSGSGSWSNPLIYGDFKERWLRINGSFQLNPTYTKIATADETDMLFFNKTTGAIAYKPANNFLTTNGTVAGNPITGQLEYKGGDTVGVPNTYGLYSQNDIKVSGFTIQDDGDLIPMMYVKDKVSGNVVNVLEVLSGVINTKTKFSMGAKSLITDDTDLVSKEWVQDYVTQSTISVPNPPSTGNYTLQSVNGVMNWVAN